MNGCSKTKLNQEKSLYKTDGTPGEQLDAYSRASQKNVDQAVKGLNNIGPEHKTNNIDNNNR